MRSLMPEKILFSLIFMLFLLVNTLSKNALAVGRHHTVWEVKIGKISNSKFSRIDRFEKLSVKQIKAIQDYENGSVSSHELMRALYQYAAEDSNIQIREVRYIENSKLVKRIRRAGRSPI